MGRKQYLREGREEERSEKQKKQHGQRPGGKFGMFRRQYVI